MAGATWARAPAAHADGTLDVQILQTASALEAVAVATYGESTTARGLAGLAGPALSTMRTFVADSRRQHTAHLQAFQARTTAVDPSAKVQDAPHPTFQALLAGADLATPAALVDFAGLVEQATVDTYLRDLTQLTDAPSKALVAAVMAVAGQRLAVLRTVKALLAAGATQFVQVPLSLALLSGVPQAVVPAAFPASLHAVGPPERIAEPASGAVR